MIGMERFCVIIPCFSGQTEQLNIFLKVKHIKVCIAEENKEPCTNFTIKKYERLLQTVPILMQLYKLILSEASHI